MKAQTTVRDDQTDKAKASRHKQYLPVWYQKDMERLCVNYVFQLRLADERAIKTTRGLKYLVGKKKCENFAKMIVPGGTRTRGRSIRSRTRYRLRYGDNYSKNLIVGQGIIYGIAAFH